MILHRDVPFWVVRFASMCYFRWPSNVVHYAHVWIWLFSRSLLVFCCSVSVYFSAIRIKMISTLVFCSWINEKQKLHEKKLKTNDQPFDAISQMDYGFIMSNAKYRRFGHFVLYYLFNRNSLWFLFFLSCSNRSNILTWNIVNKYDSVRYHWFLSFQIQHCCFFSRFISLSFSQIIFMPFVHSSIDSHNDFHTDRQFLYLLLSLSIYLSLRVEINCLFVWILCIHSK